ncbi:anti-CBASS protein Acb1 family protein [Enterobacter sp.]|uniref:anti-CBASS protein Acb1 family protein n=1 Tax=Enterobacter sp. TaxID=42895 RepID=UPI00296F88ED|nr:anti-CBASS Acb1 family protein [Enterobacter sp.]
MNNNLQLAVNHALADARFARARMLAANPTMGLDAKRNSAWCEYGFKEDLTFDDLYRLYRRGGIAHGAVRKITGTCWLSNPEIIEGEKADETRKVTDWERRVKGIFTHRFWRAFAEADLRRLVGRYSGILLHIRDGKDWNLPVTRGKGLEKITVAWAGALVPLEWDTGLNSRTYGQPKMWQYVERLPNGSTRRVDVHPERVFILGDYSTDAIGFLEPAYNPFVSLEKVEGGSGESFLKNAARQLNINFDKEIDFSNLASMYNVDVTELQEKFNEAAVEVNRGNDALLTTQGATVTPLVSAVADPGPTYNVNLQTAAAALDIPTKILVGMQTGERASTEDQRYFNARCQSRRGDLSFDIEDLCDKLVALGILDAVPQKTVIWDDLNASTDAEKLASAKLMADINSASIATGEQPFTGEEIRVAAGHEGSPEPLEEDDEDEENETSDSAGKS